MSFWKKHRGLVSSKGSNAASATRRSRRAFPRVFKGRQLLLERLEERCVLSVATVNTALDVVNLSDGVTSLREAVFFSNALIGQDTIQFDASLNGQTILLSLGEMTITDELHINGPDAGAGRVVHGDEIDVVFHALQGTLHGVGAFGAAFNDLDAHDGDVRAELHVEQLAVFGSDDEDRLLHVGAIQKLLSRM